MRVLTLSVLTLLAAFGAYSDPITPLAYSTAYNQGLGLIFPVGVGHPQSGSTATFYFTGVETFLNGSVSNVWEGCSPFNAAAPGNGVTGCGTTRPAPSVYATATNPAGDVTAGATAVNNPGDTQTYQGTTSSLASGVDETGSFSVSRTSGSATESGYVNDYLNSTEALTVAPDATHAAGTTGNLVLTYTINQPVVTGSVDGANAFWYGIWKFSSWLADAPAGANSFQQGGIDLTTVAAATQLQFIVPFEFGSASILRIGEDVGMGWSATGTGAVTASGTFDPFQSLTGIRVLDSTGAVVSNVSISDDAGNQFGPQGLVPEPSSYVPLAAALIALLFINRRRRIPLR